MRRSTRLACLITVAASLAATHAHSTGLPPDIAVYGEQPSTFRNGTTPFPSNNLWEYHVGDNDIHTWLKFREVPGLANPLGTFPTGAATFGKYVLLGNGATVSTGGSARASSVGIFDTETKQYCELSISTQNPKGVPYLAVANPNKRQSRIIFATGVSDPVGGYIMADLDVGDACSWPVVLVDTDELNGSVTPICPQVPPLGGINCTFDGFALLAHEEPNPDDHFGVDYIAIHNYYGNSLGGDTARGVAVVAIDNLHMQSVAYYPNPSYAMPSGDGRCYSSAQATGAESNFKPVEQDNRNGDWRFLVNYDAFAVARFVENPPAECSVKGFCPQDGWTDGQGHNALGKDCPNPPNDSCGTGYCFYNPKQSCGSDSTCIYTIPDPPNPPIIVNLGPCTHACLTRATAFTCKTTSGGGSLKPCLPDGQQSYYCPNTDERCCSLATCSSDPLQNIDKAPSAAQEFRYLKSSNSLGPTSPKFYAVRLAGEVPAGTGRSSTVYDTDGASWVRVDGYTHAVYQPKGAGYTCKWNCNSAETLCTNVTSTANERCYYKSSPGNAAVIVKADDVLNFDVFNTIPYLPTTVQVGNRMYVADVGALQYATRSIFATWTETPATTFKLGFAYTPGAVHIDDPTAPIPRQVSTSLPLDPRRCLGSIPANSSQLACNVNADCPTDPVTLVQESCVYLGEGGLTEPTLLSAHKSLTLGGSPPSLWTTSGYAQRLGVGYPPNIAQTDMFLLRVPVTTPLPDNASTTRPAIAFDGYERLWLASEHGGELKYRVRLLGAWSTDSTGAGWFSLRNASDTVTAVGGAAIIASGTSGVRVYARSSSGQVYEKVTTNAFCDPGACVWSNWTALPTNMTTNDDVAAAYVGGGPARFVAIRGAADNGVYLTRNNSTWNQWFRVGTLMATDRGPSLTYHAPDGKIWIAAKLNGNSTPAAQMYTQIDPTTLSPSAWSGPQSGGGPSAFSMAPGIVSDGQAIRMVSTDSAQGLWEIAHDGSGWSDWRKSPAGGASTRQPAVANVSGEVDLFTMWANTLSQASLP